MHPECFRKFIYAKTLDKRKCKAGNVTKSKIQRTTRSSQSIETADKRGVFPDICICKKKRKLKLEEETIIQLEY